MADHTARIRVTADTSKAERALRNVGKAGSVAERSMDRLGKKTQQTGARMAGLRKEAASMRGAFAGKVGLTAGILGMAVALDQAADRAVELNNVNKVLKIGVDGAAAAVANQVDKLTLAKQANRLMQAGVIQSEQQFTKLAGAVANAADNAGQDLAQALERTTKALINGNVDALGPRLALTLDQRTAERKLADSLGITTTELTKQQRQQIALKEFTEGTTEQLGEFGGATANAAVRLVALRNQIRNTIDDLLTIDQHFGELAKTLHQEVQGALVDMGDSADQATNRIDKWGARFHNALVTISPVAKMVGMEMRDINAEFSLVGQNLATLQRRRDAAMQQQRAAQKAQADAVRSGAFASFGALGFTDDPAVAASDTGTAGGGRGRRRDRRGPAMNTFRTESIGAVDVSGQANRNAAAGRLGDLERQVSAKERQLELMEMEQATLAETSATRMEILELERQAVEARAASGEINAIQQREQLAEINHRAELQRKRERMEAAEMEAAAVQASIQQQVEAMQGLAQVASVTATAANDVSGLVAQAATQSGASAKKVEAFQRATSAGVLTIQGFQYAAEAAAAAAGLNPVLAAAKGVAAGIAFAKAALVLSAPTSGMRGGGGGARGGTPGPNPFASGGGPQFRDRVDSDVVGSSIDAAQAPVSNPGESGANGPSIIIQGDVVGNVNDKWVRSLTRTQRRLTADEGSRFR